MNYLLQINAFWDLQDEMQLNSSEIALWFVLMNVNNRLGWRATFTKASSTLREQAGLSERNFFKVRNVLQQKKLITVETRKGNQSAVYSIVNLYEDLRANNADSSSDNGADNGSDNQSGSSAPLNKPKHKQNLNGSSTPATTPDIDNTHASESALFEKWTDEIVPDFESEFGRQLSSMERKAIVNMFEQYHYSKTMVLEALKEAVLSQALNLKYISTILASWRKRGINTPEMLSNEQRERAMS